MVNKKFVITQIITNLCILIVAVLGSVFVNLGMEWYMRLAKPTQWVPAVVFPIVWSLIYLLTAIALFVWQKHGKVPTYIYVLFVINGILNILWCLIFFTLNQLLFGLIAIVLNLIMAFWLVIQVFKQNETYGYMLCIYPFWLCLATTLNLATWILN